MRLKDKTALITGGARGIGLAFVEAYLKEGARVVIADVGGAQDAAAKMGDKAMGVTMDVTDQASSEAGVKAAADWGGGIDILLNNAAIFDLAPIVDITRASYDKIFAVNVAGIQRYHPTLTLKYIVPTFLDGRVRKSQEILEQLQTHYNTQLCPPIRYSVRLSEAPGYGQTIYEYASTSSGAEDYRHLTEKIAYGSTKENS